MALIFLALEAGLIYAATWVLWQIFKRLVVRSPLDNIPGPPSQSFHKGNLGQYFDRFGWDFQRELSEKYGSVVKIHGAFGSKRLFVYDPLAMHSIIVKNQDIYGSPDAALIAKDLIFGRGLLSATGDHHRKQRKLLNPVFSANHMRDMLPVFYKVIGTLRKTLASKVGNGPTEIDMLDWMSRTALELIGQGGLGYSFGSLEDTPNPYGDAMKRLLPALFSLSIFRPLLPLVVRLGSPAFRKWVVGYMPSERIQRVREVVDALDENSREILEGKRKAMREGDEAVLQQVGEGKDIMSKLLQANAAVSQEDKLPDDELLGQMSTLTFAATDTTSSALARTLHLLAEHQDVQDKLRKEIIEARDAFGEIPYDELVELPFLDAICRETLRLYSPVSWITREALKDAVLPLSTPIRGVDGTMISEIVVPKHTAVIVGLIASNRNSAIWGEDALEWKPERWLSPLPESVEKAHLPGVYSHLMTFSGGSHGCIGFKFSQLEMKVVLSVMLESFTFAPTDEPIAWNLAAVHYPTVESRGTKSQLPLKVGLVKSKFA